MAKTATRKKGPPTPVERKRYAARLEKQELARTLRDTRAVKKLSAQIVRALRENDAKLRDLTMLLADRCGLDVRETDPEPNQRKRAAAPNSSDKLAELAGRDFVETV